MAKSGMSDLLKKRMAASQQASELQASDEAYEKLFQEALPPASAQICSLPLDRLVPFFTADIGFRPYFPAQLKAFSEQLKEEGLLVRIIVRPTAMEGSYEILAGHNRVNAAKMADWTEIPAEIVEVDDARAIVIATSTNLIQRQNLSIIERGKAYKALLDAKNRHGQWYIEGADKTFGDNRQKFHDSLISETPEKGMGTFPEGVLESSGEEMDSPPVDSGAFPQGDAAGGEGLPAPDSAPDAPREDSEQPDGLEGAEDSGSAAVPTNPLIPPAIAGGAEDAAEEEQAQISDASIQETLEPAEDRSEAAQPDEPSISDVGNSTKAPPPKSDRQSFYDLDFNGLDRDLTAEERQEWNSIYASYRDRSALTGTIIGVDPHSISVRNRQTGKGERQTMYCAIVIPYRVRIVIPAPEMWEAGHERPDFVLQNMAGASIDFIITKVDRESGFAIASRRMAARSQRYFFAHRESLCREGVRLKCRVLSVGPRRCLVECYGHDINMTQWDLRYTAIPDLRNEYHPGQELDCIVKGYDPETEALCISVKETESNPFEGAELRHPAGSRRQAVIAGKYGGGVFCNLPDGAVCMCSYSYQHEDSDFQVGDTVILVVQRFDREKRQMYGKILIKW